MVIIGPIPESKKEFVGRFDSSARFLGQSSADKTLEIGTSFNGLL
jgi:hypothetical protein